MEAEQFPCWLNWLFYGEVKERRFGGLWHQLPAVPLLHPRAVFLNLRGRWSRRGLPARGRPVRRRHPLLLRRLRRHPLRPLIRRPLRRLVRVRRKSAMEETEAMGTPATAATVPIRCGISMVRFVW